MCKLKDVFFWVVVSNIFYFILFSPLFGEMIQFDSYFSNGLKPPSSFTSFLVDEGVFFMTETESGDSLHPSILMNHQISGWR